MKNSLKLLTLTTLLTLGGLTACNTNPIDKPPVTPSPTSGVVTLMPGQTVTGIDGVQITVAKEIEGWDGKPIELKIDTNDSNSVVNYLDSDRIFVSKVYSISAKTRTTSTNSVSILIRIPLRGDIRYNSVGLYMITSEKSIDSRNQEYVLQRISEGKRNFDYASAILSHLPQKGSGVKIFALNYNADDDSAVKGGLASKNYSSESVICEPESLLKCMQSKNHALKLVNDANTIIKGNFGSIPNLGSYSLNSIDWLRSIDPNLKVSDLSSIIVAPLEFIPYKKRLVSDIPCRIYSKDAETYEDYVRVGYPKIVFGTYYGNTGKLYICDLSRIRYFNSKKNEYVYLKEPLGIAESVNPEFQKDGIPFQKDTPLHEMIHSLQHQFARDLMESPNKNRTKWFIEGLAALGEKSRSGEVGLTDRNSLDFTQRLTYIDSEINLERDYEFQDFLAYIAMKYNQQTKSKDGLKLLMRSIKYLDIKGVENSNQVWFGEVGLDKGGFANIFDAWWQFNLDRAIENKYPLRPKPKDVDGDSYDVACQVNKKFIRDSGNKAIMTKFLNLSSVGTSTTMSVESYDTDYRHYEFTGTGSKDLYLTPDFTPDNKSFHCLIFGLLAS